MKKLLLISLLLLIPSLLLAAPATMLVTPAGAGTKDGSTWANAMGLGEWTTDLVNSAEAGDIYYVAGGTYTLTANMATLKVGTVTAPIQIIGVISGTTNAPPVFADWAFTTNRPLIACSIYQFYVNEFSQVSNLQFTGTTDDRVFQIDASSWIYNCKANNSSASASRAAIRMADYTHTIYNSEMQSVNGYGLYSGDNDTFVIGCYIHDCSMGIYSVGHRLTVSNSVIDTCSTYGIRLRGNNNIIVNNTIYGCVTGLTTIIDTIGNSFIINNIFDANTTGASWVATAPTNFWDYNVWDNTTDVTNVTKGPHDITGDPSLNDPANGDFTLKAGSNALNAGMAVGVNTGCVGTY